MLPYSRRLAECLSAKRVTPGSSAGRQTPEDLRLEENLESEIDGTAALEQSYGMVQVDLVRGSQHGSRFGVIPDPNERLGAPPFDQLDLDIGSFLELCRRHLASLQRFPDSRIFVRETGSDVPFLGYSVKGIGEFE
jgi:hypothetical protein